MLGAGVDFFFGEETSEDLSSQLRLKELITDFRTPLPFLLLGDSSSPSSSMSSALLSLGG